MTTCSFWSSAMLGLRFIAAPVGFLLPRIYREYRRMTAKIRSRYYRGRAAQPVPPPSATVMPLYLVGLRRGLASDNNGVSVADNANSSLTVGAVRTPTEANAAHAAVAASDDAGT